MPKASGSIRSGWRRWLQKCFKITKKERKNWIKQSFYSVFRGQLNMPKFLDVPEWYNSSGALEKAWDSRGTKGQLLKADGDGTVSWSAPSNFKTRSTLLGQATGGANVTLSSSMLNYTFLSITVQCTNYHGVNYKPFWQILLVPSLFYDYCSQSSGDFGLYWGLYLESAGYLSIFATSATSIKWKGSYDNSMYTMYVHGVYFALN